MSQINSYPIIWSELKKYASAAKNILMSSSWSERDAASKSTESDEVMRMHARLKQHTYGASLINVTASVGSLKSKIAPDLVVAPDGLNHTIITLQEAIQIGYFIADAFAKNTQLEELQKSFSGGNLSQSSESILEQLRNSQAGVLLFTVAKYVVWKLKQHKPDQISALELEIGDIPDVALTNRHDAISCMMYYYDKSIRADVVDSDEKFVKVTLLYFEKLLTEIQKRSGSFAQTDYFTSASYNLENSSFTISGFDSRIGITVKAVEIPRLEFDEIVGNHRIKRNVKRNAQFLASYNFHKGKNPVMELVKSYPNIIMGDGYPGTGKTMMGQATATMLNDICMLREVPFIYHEFPKVIKSKWVGGTASNTKEWFKMLQRNDAIIFAPIDDAEGLLKVRTAENQDGSGDIVQIFLTETEGIASLYRGNWVIMVLTNYPEMIDPAVLSRIKSREAIPGAETVHDFMDQTYLWMKSFGNNLGSYNDLKPPNNYKFLNNQIISFDTAITAPDQYSPKRSEVTLAYERALKHASPDEYLFVGHLYKELHEISEKKFTSREMRNVQTSVDNRRLNFLYPDKWMKDPTIFFNIEDYDEQVRLLNGLMTDNLGGQKMSHIYCVETLIAADNFFRIHANHIEREAEKYADRITIQERGNRIYRDRNENN